MNPIDIAFLAVMGYGVFKGLTQGFIGTIIQIVKYSIAFGIALRFSSLVATILSRLFHISSAYTPLIAFLFVFIGTASLIFVLGQIMDSFIKAAHLGSLNKAFGVMLWSFILATGFSGLLNLGEQGNVLSYDLINQSTIYPFISPVSTILWCKMGYFMPALDSIYTSLVSIMSGIANYAIGNCAG